MSVFWGTVELEGGLNVFATVFTGRTDLDRPLFKKIRYTPVALHLEYTQQYRAEECECVCVCGC